MLKHNIGGGDGLEGGIWTCILRFLANVLHKLKDCLTLYNQELINAAR